ncbi:MAG: flagellin FliC [Deltaproteobacteria bacterium]|nr:flagellin FliC [Deltaproteobacteria bacterium]
MALNIFTNVPSLNAQRHLANSTQSLTKSLERLATGLRINAASDDAAGLAIADRLRADVRIASQAIRNANDGVSAISLGEKALGKVGEILTRLSELASQSASGTVTDTQRSAISTEFVALVSEVDRISNTTTFNGVNLLSGGTTVDLQVGIDGTTNSRISFTTVDGSSSGVGLTNVAVSTAASAQSALGAIGSAIATVAQRRGNLGAVESRLSTAIQNLRVARENFAAAESRIRDADIAEETASLTRNTILQQAGVAILAQANQQPSLALQLLR